MIRCEAEMCWNWTGNGCACEFLGMEPDVVREDADENNCPPTCPDGCWDHQDFDRISYERAALDEGTW